MTIAAPVADSMKYNDAVWPKVPIDGDLERARPEWIHTNGAGAYASSTLALLHTRRYHGLLVAALAPPKKRHVILSQMDLSVDLAAKSYDLGTHQFPNVPPTGGYRYLRSFAQDPLPRWTFRVEGGTLEQTIALVRGQNAVVLRYGWRGPSPIGLKLRPLLALRPHHGLVHEHGSMVQSVELRPGEVRVRPVPTLPKVVFGHQATFIGSPDWWRRFEYLTEQARGLDFQEDLWTPGNFSVDLAPEKETYLVVGVDGLPTGEPHELLDDAAARIVERDPGPAHSPVRRMLSIACGAFDAREVPEPGIIAGYPWFEMWGRDTLIALPGIHLVQGNVTAARQVLATLIREMDGGLVPSRLPDEGRPAEFDAADATLWLFEAARLYAEQVEYDDPFLGGELLEALAVAFEAALLGTRHNIHVTEQGLFAASDDGFALTWMDAKIGDFMVTRRAGLPVELQGLWARACDTLANLADGLGRNELAARARLAHGRAIDAFRRRFWCRETGYPFDVVSESMGAGSWQDSAIRPNAVIALAVEPRLFEPAQAASILAVVERELLTPAGLRTLSPRSSGYRTQYRGGVQERDLAYHQGTVWPYLLGYYVRAAMARRPRDEGRRQALVRLVVSAAKNALALGQVPELAEADPPHRPDGCVAQAWSVAELLRALAWDLA
jgi:predicted glycogen debranching enzyme